MKPLTTIPHENLHCTKCGARHDWIQRPPTMCAKCWGEWLDKLPGKQPQNERAR